MGRETIADRILREFSNRFAGSPRLYRSPGRINIIGEHTDYNGGHVLPATLDLYTWAAMAPEDDPVLCIYLSDQDKTLSIPCGTAPMQKTGTEEDYFRGVLWALQQEGIEIAGCNIVIAGNLPIGAGLSSSASLEILLASMLLDRTGLVLPLQKIAMICHRAETQFVGVQCGIMDQYAIALGDPGTAMLIDCKSARYEKVPSPEDCCFFLVDSGVRRKLASGFFNERRKQCSQALVCLQNNHPELTSLCELEIDELNSRRSQVDELLFRRARHVVTENQRALDAKQLMKQADVAALGELMMQSHASLRDDFEVSCPELDQLVTIAEACPGVLGSRMMGAGLGGCTINLVMNNQLQETSNQIAEAYLRLHNKKPWMHATGAAEPPGRVRLQQVNASI